MYVQRTYAYMQANRQRLDAYRARSLPRRWRCCYAKVGRPVSEAASQLGNLAVAVEKLPVFPNTTVA